MFSLANAHGSILDKTYLYDMIRPGIGIYGCYENKKLEKKILVKNGHYYHFGPNFGHFWVDKLYLKMKLVATDLKKK